MMDELIDFDEVKILENYGVNELIYAKNLKNRKIYLSSDIDEMVISEAVQHILQYNIEDIGIPSEQRKPIKIYLSSRGGEVDAGFELIDAIQMSLTPVYTINLGYQYSMGFLIGLAGHKRYASKNAKYLMHDGTYMVVNSGTKVKDQMEFQNKIEERIKRYVLERSKITEDEYDLHLRQEWYLFADEAKEKGFTDYIIGEDCDLVNIL